MGSKKHGAKPFKQKKVATSPNSPPIIKAARRAEDPTSTNHMRPAWVFTSLDENGPWGRCKLEDNTVWEDILPNIRAYESMTWAEIELDKKRNHSVPVSGLCKEARKRAQEIRLDVDDLFRFRFSGKQRLWGIRDRNMFKLLWWDPGHEICPSELKNT